MEKYKENLDSEKIEHINKMKTIAAAIGMPPPNNIIKKTKQPSQESDKK